MDDLADIIPLRLCEKVGRVVRGTLLHEISYLTRLKPGDSSEEPTDVSFSCKGFAKSPLVGRPKVSEYWADHSPHPVNVWS